MGLSAYIDRRGYEQTKPNQTKPDLTPTSFMFDDVKIAHNSLHIQHHSRQLVCMIALEQVGWRAACNIGQWPLDSVPCGALED